MRIKLHRHLCACLLTIGCCFLFANLHAQTEHDAIMLNKGQWCNGFLYRHARWDKYWEGTFKRSNENLGTLSTQSVMYMTNYGLTNQLNILAALPYVWTRASQGTLHPMNGLQDGGLYLKWKPLTTTLGRAKLSLLTVASISTPLRHYSIDFLPLSIGLGSTNLSGRILADYQQKHLFTTLSAAYVRRSNVKLDRTSYYTTDIHNTPKVKMPDVALYNFSIGVRKKYLVAEALLSNMTTLGGFDIRKNDMPFPSNKMNSTTAGAHLKYTLPGYPHLEVTGDAAYTLSGRNVGQAAAFGVGAYYIFSFRHP